tara:strand:- start:429 stop:614 length:186 start_codon:yes stop_codon:yes gene_type:complete
MGQTMSDCTSKRQECNEEISFGGKYSTLEINKDNLHYSNIIDNCDYYLKKKKKRRRRIKKI